MPAHHHAHHAAERAVGDLPTRPHLFDQTLAQQLGGKLLSRTAPQLWRQRDAAIFALRGSGQNDQLSIAELHRILRSASDGNHPPSPPKPRKWRKSPAGQDPGSRPAPTLTLCSQRKSSPNQGNGKHQDAADRWCLFQIAETSITGSIGI